MNFKLITLITGLILSNLTLAGRPNITDFEITYLQYSKYPSASVMTSKGLTDSGEKERKSVSLDRFDFGVFRERYDNKFAEFSIFLAKSKSGDESVVVGAGEAEIKEQIGFSYSSGMHLSRTVDWALSMDISTASTIIDGEKESDVGLGIGNRITITPYDHLEFGITINVGSIYSAGGLQVRVLF